MTAETKTENLDEFIAEQFTPEKRLLPRPVGLSLPIFQHPIVIEDSVTSFRNHVEHFVKEVTPLITEDYKYTNVPKDLRKPEGETEPVFDYEGAVQIFDIFYEIQNRRLILGHEDKETDVAFGRLYSSGYSLGRLLLAEEVLKRDDPSYHREQKHNLISEILFQYANIGLQETIILRNRHEEAKDALWKQHNVEKQMNDELYIHNNNYFAFHDAAERAYENALPKKLANLVHEQNLTLYEGEEIAFLPDHLLLAKMLKGSVDVFLGQIDDIPSDSMDQKFVHEVKDYIVQAERELWQKDALYREEITEPYLSAMKYHLDLELVKKTGKDAGDLLNQLTHYYLISGTRQLGLSQPVLGHTIDLQMRLRPSLLEWYENKHSRLPEFMDHALWVYGLKEDKPINYQTEEFPPPIVDMDGPLN